MTELDFMLINYELNRLARRTRRARRTRFYVISNILGTLLGLGIVWLAAR